MEFLVVQWFLASSPASARSPARRLLEVTFRSGDVSGNQLKAIPEATVSNALQVALPSNLDLGVTHKYVGSVFLDDENTTKLPSYGTFDASLGYEWKDVRFHLSIMNVTDAENNSTGFLLFDQSTFENVQFLYPAQGRSIRFAIDL